MPVCKRVSTVAAFVLSFTCLLFPASGRSEPNPVADFYQRKTITILIGFPVGGSYDTYARLAAAHLGQFLPGHPSIVVQSRPGGSGVGAVLYFNANAPKGRDHAGAFPGDHRAFPSRPSPRSASGTFVISPMSAPSRTRMGFSSSARMPRRKPLKRCERSRCMLAATVAPARVISIRPYSRPTLGSSLRFTAAIQGRMRFRSHSPEERSTSRPGPGTRGAAARFCWMAQCIRSFRPARAATRKWRTFR